MQTFMIPGTIFFSLLAGALFGVYKGVLLVIFSATSGAACCFLMSKSFSFAVISLCLSLALTLSSRFHLTRQLRNTRRPKRFVCCRFFYMFCQSIIQSVEWKWCAIMYLLYISFAYVMEYKKERCVMCVYIYICARLYLTSYTCKLCCMHVYVFLCVYI